MEVVEVVDWGYQIAAGLIIAGLLLLLIASWMKES
jgi:hypothetical protein